MIGARYRLPDAPELAPGVPDLWAHVEVVGQYAGEPVLRPVDQFADLPEGVAVDRSPKTVSHVNLQRIGYVLETQGNEPTAWTNEAPA